MARRLVASLFVACAVICAPADASVTPTLTAAAQGGDAIDHAYLYDEATLSGSDAATGIITFTLYGPDDPACARPPAFTTSVPVEGDGSYLSDGWEPTAVGTYRFVASYSGNSGNDPVATTCDDESQTVVVTPDVTELVTTASSSVTVGGQITDTARLGSTVSPTGTLTFTLYGPDDDTCSRVPAAVFAVPVTDADDRYTSPPFTAQLPGLYRWIASYSGDDQNPSASGSCGDEGESVVVTSAVAPAAEPKLSVRGSATTHAGEHISATATLTTGGLATGTLTFRVYGPDDTACERGAVAASTRTVLGDGAYVSDPFTPTVAGVYRFVVSYAGAGVGATATTSCADTAAAVSVLRAPALVPVLERSFLVARVDGSVRVRTAARTARAAAAARRIRFVEVRGEHRFPLGSTVDTTAGAARLTAARKRRGLQSGVFRGARFVVRQRARDQGLVELRMRSGAGGRCGREGPRASKRRKLGKRARAKLRARVRGRFRTRGDYSSASARGTAWVMAERCDSTLTRVLSGVVVVRDFSTARRIVLRAGQFHAARKKVD